MSTKKKIGKLDEFLKKHEGNFDPHKGTDPKLLFEIIHRNHRRKKAKDFVTKPGSYRRVLNRKKKGIGCLFFESNTKENDKFEGNFVLIAREVVKKLPIKPIVQYDSTCFLCKSNQIKVNIQGKLWRKHSTACWRDML